MSGPITSSASGSLLDPIAFLTGGNPPPGNLSDYHFLRMCGDSLAETAGIFDGDLLLVRKSSEPRPGEMALVLVGDHSHVIRFESDGWRGMVDDLRGPNKWTVQGVVCGIVRRF